MEQFILVNGKKVFVTVEVTKSGKMDHIMKDIGITTKLTVRDVLFILMVTFMKENGKMTKLMELVFTNILMALNIEANGSKTNKKVKV